MTDYFVFWGFLVPVQLSIVGKALFLLCIHRNQVMGKCKSFFPANHRIDSIASSMDPSNVIESTLSESIPTESNHFEAVNPANQTLENGAVTVCIEPNRDVCCICLDRFVDTSLTCRHMFCRECITILIETNIATVSCPLCKQAITLDFIASFNTNVHMLE